MTGLTSLRVLVAERRSRLFLVNCTSQLSMFPLKWQSKNSGLFQDFFRTIKNKKNLSTHVAKLQAPELF